MKRLYCRFFGHVHAIHFNSQTSACLVCRRCRKVLEASGGGQIYHAGKNSFFRCVYTVKS